MTSNIIDQSGQYSIKVAEHSFGSLWVYVICQIMTRGRLQLTSWNLASEKFTDEKFWLTFSSFPWQHERLNTTLKFQFCLVYIKFAH